jgi:multidrug efflux pump subunit AcrA (membrane-fusion protein)
MKIEPVHCPACFAAATVPPGADRVTCDYCGTTSFIEQSHGQVTLKFEHELAGLRQTLQDSSAQTAQSMRASAEETQKEIQRLRLSQELSTVEMRLDNVQAEYRALTRNNDKKQSKTVKAQLAQLEREGGWLAAQRANIHNSLNALNPDPMASARASMASNFATGQAGGNRMMGCLGWGILWAILFTVISSLFMSVLGDTGAMIGFILSIVVVVYFQRRRKRKEISAA